MHARCLLQIEAATNGYHLHRYFYEFKKIMMMNAIVLLATVAVSFALKAPTIVPNTLAKVVFSPLPKVYVYDHCPFCGKHCVLLPRILGYQHKYFKIVATCLGRFLLTTILSQYLRFENADVSSSGANMQPSVAIRTLPNS